MNSSDISGRCPICVAVPLSTWLIVALIGTAAYYYVVAAGGVKIPFPNPKSWSAKKYKRTNYRIYRIYSVKTGKTFKYGLTRVGGARPHRQLETCRRYTKHGWRPGGRCAYQWVWSGTGWTNARRAEASFILNYANKYGKCPPGQYKSCI
ncbi:hypothetical protein DUHN55_46870 [Helicobacter pylori]